jgi:hypothetical protein
LATLLSLKKDIIHDVFITLKLVSKRNIKGETRVILNQNGVDNFMTCYQIDAEVTSFEIQKKWHVFICLGYWDETPSNK